MDSYTKLMTSIDEKYSGEEVEQSENIISLYDLVKMLEEEMEPLRKLKLDDEFYNKINADRTVFQRIGLFRKKAVVNQKCTGGYTDTGEDRSKISVHFDNGKDLGTHVVLYKDFGSDEIYFDDFCLKDRGFVEKYISDIYGIFAILESYGTLFPYEEKKGRTGLSQEFDDGLLNIKVSLDTYGRVTPLILPVKGTDPDNLYARAWYSRETVSEHVNNMSEDILRRIPVEISSLNEVYKMLVERAIGKRQAKLLGKTIGGMAN